MAEDYSMMPGDGSLRLSFLLINIRKLKKNTNPYIIFLSGGRGRTDRGVEWRLEGEGLRFGRMGGGGDSTTHWFPATTGQDRTNPHPGRPSKTSPIKIWP